VKARIQRHIDSLLTSLAEHFEHLAKGAAAIAHKLVLAHKENAELRAANEAAMRRKSHKRKRVLVEGAGSGRRDLNV
jgi:1,2-phenylacetyl-CoA epoxidase catalytic subunit